MATWRNAYMWNRRPESNSSHLPGKCSWPSKHTFQVFPLTVRSFQGEINGGDPVIHFHFCWYFPKLQSEGFTGMEGPNTLLSFPSKNWGPNPSGPLGPKLLPSYWILRAGGPWTMGHGTEISVGSFTFLRGNFFVGSVLVMMDTIIHNVRYM